MSKTKQQTQLVSKFLTPKQLKSLKMSTDSSAGQCEFVFLNTNKKGEEFFQTNSDGDNVFFSLSLSKNKEIIIKVGSFVSFYSETKLNETIEMDGEEVIVDYVLDIIKSQIKQFTDMIGNSVSPIWK
jgi:hypothetical protein